MTFGSGLVGKKYSYLMMADFSGGNRGKLGSSKAAGWLAKAVPFFSYLLRLQPGKISSFGHSALQFLPSTLDS